MQLSCFYTSRKHMKTYHYKLSLITSSTLHTANAKINPNKKHIRLITAFGKDVYSLMLHSYSVSKDHDQY